jgi:hypothetical protein
MPANPCPAELSQYATRLRERKEALIDLYRHFNKVRHLLEPDEVNKHVDLFQMQLFRTADLLNRIEENLPEANA